MVDQTTRTMMVRMKVKRYPVGAGRRLALTCMECGSPLEIHQPDQESPDRILGTCDECHGWVVADFATDRDDGVMVFLPGPPLEDSLGLAL